HVYLHRLHSRALTRIGYVYLHVHAAARVDLPGSKAQVAVLELRITQSISEGVQRCARHVSITAVPVSRFDPVLLGWLVVVEGGQLTRTARYGDRQAAGGIEVPEQNIGHRFAPVLSRFPRLHD